MTQATPETTVRKTITVVAPIDVAYRVFTERFGDFKPREHNIMPVPIEDTVFEARVGGYIYDRGADGTVCRWARVVELDAPNRVVFTWDIGPTWQVEQDKSKTSEVEVRFTAESDGRTRVDLEHRHLDRHGTGWEAVADGVGHDAGWPQYLAAYRRIVEAG